jgi:hypothetical protein
MAQNEKLIEVLEGKIETRILPKLKYPYVPASAIRTRLNEAFACLWGTRVVSHKVINDDTVLLLLELSATVGDATIKKEAFGSAPIHKYTSGANKGKAVNLGDAYGNAVMDGLKACAKQFGIGNKEMDVVKDPDTGEYIQVSDVDDKKTNVNKPTQQESASKTPSKKEEVSDEDKVVKLAGIRKKLEENKKKKIAATQTEQEPVNTEQKTKEETKQEPTEEEQNITTDHGFDYSGVGDKEKSPKNTQKLVIINLAKMQRLSPEDYIEKILGSPKNIDDLTGEEAGRIVRSGLTTTFEQ